MIVESAKEWSIQPDTGAPMMKAIGIAVPRYDVARRRRAFGNQVLMQ
jgi:hypothetical protein